MRKILRILAAVLALGVFLFSAWKLLDRSRQMKETVRVTQAYASLAVTILPAPQEPPAQPSQPGQPSPAPSAPENPTAQPTASDPAEDSPPDTDPEAPKPAPVRESPIYVDFDALQAQCGSIIAWLYCADTPISYPIVQSADNDYFLRRLPDGQYNYSGSLFMDYRCAGDFTDFCSVVYGHHLRSTPDVMFGPLLRYREQSYYDAHPVMYLAVPGQTYRVELICGRETDSSSDVYRFPKTEEERAPYVRLLSESSTFRSGVAFDENDRILLLSTCSYSFTGARYVLAGKMVPID